MELPDNRRIGERREADQRIGEGRRIDTARRTRSRRHGALGEPTDGDEFDRRGAHPSLFATLGFTLVRGIRRKGSPRRSGVVRRSFMRRRVDRRAT